MDFIHHMMTREPLQDKYYNIALCCVGIGAGIGVVSFGGVSVACATFNRVKPFFTNKSQFKQDPPKL